MNARPSWSMICAHAEGLLLRRRTELGLTQSVVASKVGVSLRTFKRWELEDKSGGDPSFRQTVRWMRALGIDITVTVESAISGTSESDPAAARAAA